MIEFRNTEPDQDNRKWYQRADFWIGFIGWFLVNIVLFGLQELLYISGLISFSINIVGIILLYITKPRIAQGVLGAFGSLLALTLCAGIVFTAYCFSGGVL